MKQVKIQDLQPGLISGVAVQMPGDVDPYREGYFLWEPSSLVTKYKIGDISGGVLHTWHYKPVFDEVEYHVDAEFFYFLKGSALMLFCDIADGKADMSSAQIVRIPAGAQLSIEAGKAHFVAVAEGEELVLAVVVAPKMDAPRLKMSEPVEGVK